MKKKLALSILTVCSLCVFGFTHQTNAQEILKIGGIMTTSGAAAHLGQTGLNGVMMKVDEVNAQGGITVGGKNYKIKLVNYDDKCVANDAISAAQRLLNVDKVPAIVGAICSHCTLAVMEIAEKKKIPIVCPLSGSVKVTSLGYKYIFRSWGHAGLHSEAISRFAIETLKAKKIAFLGRNDAWGRSAGDQLEKRLEKQGGELIIKDFYEHGTTDFYSKLTKIKQARPDAIYFIALAEDGAMAVKQAREIGITCTLLGTDEMANEKVYGIAGDAMEGLYFYWNGGPPTDKAKEYAKKYKKDTELNQLALTKAHTIQWAFCSTPLRVLAQLRIA